MPLLLMRFLLLSSWAIVLFSGCSPYKSLTETNNKSHCIELLNRESKTSLYTTQIDFYKKHFSGLLLIKPMNDTTHRAVFTSEMGFKFFDFEFSGSDHFKVVYIIEGMNKNYIVQILRRDLELLLPKKIILSNTNQYENQNNVYLKQTLQRNENLYYIFTNNCTQILRIEQAKKNRVKTTAFIHSYETTVMDSVFIKHHGIKLSLAFKKIEQHAAE